jgi:hypothetical protein
MCTATIESTPSFGTLDEVVGKALIWNEIVWKYSGGWVGKRFFGRKHDTIFWFSKGDLSAR